ncbi:MAG: Stk1 family PASTA domain-containing Ser/Thr kinase [Firmicutes bacterium]|nr:Stk1 family PASTA domain-containing Ser/Thr kinase [Bacillota bacterium]
MEKSTDKYIGKILDDRYEILELIGTGGMANVYKALCHRLNRYDAVKIMRDDTAADECFRKRFRTESQAVAMLSHPNIVSVYDVSHNENIEYIVMELVDGITLKQYMKEHGALPTDEVLNFSIQIAKALAHAHSKGIIHRDIKPQNVMLLKDGLIKVADFGIAALQNDIEESTNETVGSVHYIAPEQARGAAADARSDIYSLGIVMYEMMTGRLPYVGKSDVEVAVKHMNTEAVPPRTIVPGIPEELERICLKAMATDITDRYQSAGELLSDLEQFRKQLAEASALKADVSSQSIETENIEVEDAGRRKRKKKSKFALGSGVIAVLILIILVFVFVNGYFIKDLFSTPDKVDVPSFIGRYYEDVINDADYESQFKFTVTVKVDTEHDYGIIIEQNPKEGESRTLKNKDDRADVELVISSGNVIQDEIDGEKIVPDIVNKEFNEAIQLVKKAGFNYEISEAPSQSITKDYVIYSSPAAGEYANAGSVVTITVSTGPEEELTDVPKLVGLSKTAAIDKIESSKLSVGSIETVDSEYEAGTVIWQSLEAGKSVTAHTKISIQISSGRTGSEA